MNIVEHCSLQGMRTYDYILAMRVAGTAFDPFENSDSDESIDFDSPEKPSFLSSVFCRKDELNEVRSKKVQNYCTSFNQ